MVRLQWTVRAKGEDDQFVRRNLMKTFRSVLSTIPPQAPVRSVTQSVCIIVLCGRVYASSSSILAIGSRCRLLTPTITFVKVKMYLVCAPQHREVRLSRNGVVHEWGLLHPARDFQQQQQPCLARRKLSLLYLLTATNNGLRSTLGRALCMTFWLGLTCYPEPQYTDLRDVSGRKAIRNARGNPVGIQGESYGSSTMGLPLTLHVRSENISLPLTTIAGLDRAGLWLASQVSGPHTNGLLTMRPHWTLDLHVASWFWRGSYCPYRWGSSNHHAATWYFWVQTSNSAALLSAVYRSRWPHVWTSALNWY